MLEQYDHITAACEAIQTRWPHQPKVGIILGSGLGNATQGVTDHVKIPYEEIPHFARSTAHGHAGQLVCGLLDGVPVIILEGGCIHTRDIQHRRSRSRYESCIASALNCLLSQMHVVD